MRDVIARKPAQPVARKGKHLKAWKIPTASNSGLQAKFSSLGYPLAGTQPAPCHVIRRAGYQRSDTLRLPPINRDQEGENPEGESAREDHTGDVKSPGKRTTNRLDLLFGSVRTA